MPVKVRVPITDDRPGGGRRPASLSDLYDVYGNPHEAGVTGQIAAYCTYVDGAADLVFVADNPDGQTTLDTWAEQVSSDTAAVIKTKIAEFKKAKT